MRTKETAKQVIDSLPNDVTMDDIIHALYANLKFAHGEEEIREGKGITREEAKRRVLSPNRKLCDRLAQLGGSETRAAAPGRRRTWR